MAKFITTDKAIANQLTQNGYVVAGTLDERIPVHEVYVAYSDRQQNRVGQYVARIWKWNVRIRNHTEVISIGWYSTPASALKAVEKTDVLNGQFLVEQQAKD